MQFKNEAKKKLSLLTAFLYKLQMISLTKLCQLMHLCRLKLRLD